MIKRFQHIARCALTISLGLTLAGCSDIGGFFSGYGDSESPQSITSKPQVVAPPDKVSALLADAATKASDALETLAAVEQNRGPAIENGTVENAPPELMRHITLRWTGPVGPVAKSLANYVGYAYNVVGDPPGSALVVIVDVENKPVIDVLRSIGLQMGLNANLRVDSNLRVVEILYPANSHAEQGMEQAIDIPQPVQ